MIFLDESKLKAHVTESNSNNSTMAEIDAKHTK